MQREDTEPWYRQFWPWFLIALPSTAVIAGFYTLWLASQTTDSLVVRRDVGIDVITAQNLNAEQQASRLGLNAKVTFGLETGAISVTLVAKPDVEFAQSLQLRLRHPTMASHDVTVSLARAMPSNDGEPTWSGHFLNPPTGPHFVILSSEDIWRLSGEWSGQSQFRLGPIDQPSNGQH